MTTLPEIEAHFARFKEGEVVIIQPKREMSWNEYLSLKDFTEAMSIKTGAKFAAVPYDFDLYRVDAKLMQSAFDADGAV